MIDEDTSLLLEKWLKEELLVFSKRVRANALDNVPEKLCRGKNAKIWIFIMNHVYSRLTVLKIRNRLRVHQYLTSHKPKSSSEICQNATSSKDFLVWQLNFLSARKALLEKLIQDLETEIRRLDVKYQTLKIDVVKGRNISSTLSKSKHLFCKNAEICDNAYTALKSGLCISKVKDSIAQNKEVFTLSLSGTNGNGIYNQLELQQGNLLFGKFNNSVIFSDVQNALNSIRDLFRLITEENGVNLKHCKNKLWSLVGKLLVSHAASDIVCCVQKNSQLDAVDLECLPMKSDNCEPTSKNSKRCLNSFANLPSSSELQKLTMMHIEVFVAKQNLIARVKCLSDESASLQKDILYKIDTECDDKLKKHIFEIDMVNNCSIHAVQRLKQLLSDIRCKDQSLEECVAKEQVKKEDVMNSQYKITNRRNALCEFLKQNKTILGSFGKKCSLYTFITNSLKSEKTALANSISQLNYNIHLEKELVARKAAGDIDAPEHSLKNALQLMHFEDESVILRKCLNVMLCAEEDISLLRQRTLHKFKCSKIPLLTPESQLAYEQEVNEDQKTVKQLAACVYAASETTKRGEQCLCMIKRDLQNWWEQPAQFIPSITVENRPLKEWKNYYALL